MNDKPERVITMIESMFSLLRPANRQLLHRIWRKASRGDVDVMSAEERHLCLKSCFTGNFKFMETGVKVFN